VQNSSKKKQKVKVSPTAEQVANALYECGGITRDAANMLKCSIVTVRRCIKRYASCREARETGLDDLREMAQDNLIDMVKDGNERATFFVLTKKRTCGNVWVSADKEIESTEQEEQLEFEE